MNTPGNLPPRVSTARQETKNMLTDDKFLFSLREAAQRMDIGRIDSGKLEIVRIGKRGIRISKTHIEKFISENSERR